MFKKILRNRSKKVVDGSVATILATSAAVISTPQVQADGSSSAGSGGGGGGGVGQSSRAADSGYSGSASYGGSSWGGGGSRSGGSSSGSGGSSGGSYGGSTMGTGTVTNGYQSVSWSGVTQGNWEASMAANGASVTTHSSSYSTANFGDGSSASWSGNTGGGGGYSSTPFLKTWNGKAYEFDNDFLFGKPETSFDNYAEGLEAYKSGRVGGDSYFLKNHLKSEKGVLKFQIKEIEPEESFIDTFRLTAVDMPKQFYPVTDGNLKDVYIFDTTKTKTVDGQTAKIHFAKKKLVSSMNNAYNHIGKTKDNGSDTTLNAGDSIVINLPIESKTDTDMFLLVDSYFRDCPMTNL